MRANTETRFSIKPATSRSKRSLRSRLVVSTLVGGSFSVLQGWDIANGGERQNEDDRVRHSE